MPRRREVPYSPIPSGGIYAQDDWTGGNLPGEGAAHTGIPLSCQAAETEMAALMEALPFCSPQLSREELLPLREIIQNALDSVLDERERWIFDACTIERKSIRALAAELQLSKSYVDRLNHKARAKLAEALLCEPLIQQYLNRWKEAA